ncbi:Gfo/Idh/MocA family protein [Melioribacter sp. OK-6-Me]|uniref:Gfo/Idh/MocA family protein n=1 Tax=unclassified Melioribacter TaxID=2627329 RepID=UPI003ED8F3AD
MKKTKVAIVGLGSIAQLVHIPVLTKMGNIELVAVSEINNNRLKTIGEKIPAARRYTDYREMISQEELDAVIVTSPTNTHKEIAIDCLNAKLDVLIEKPIALNYKEALEVDKAAKRNKKLAMVGMNLRFRPDSMLMKSIINSGELGEIFYIKCGWLRNKSSAQKWFIDKKKSGGGVIIDLGILLLDLAIWMFGNNKIESASVHKFNTKNQDVEDSAVGIVRLNSKNAINFEVSWELYSETDSFNFIIHGTKGAAQLNPLKVFRKIESAFFDYSLSKSSVSNLYHKSYENEMKHFIASLRGEVPPVSTSEEALVRMKLLDIIYKSAEQKKEVKF